MEEKERVKGRKKQRLVVFLPPSIDEEEDPRQAEQQVADGLPGAVACEVLKVTLEVEAPESEGEVEEGAAAGEEVLEVPVADEGDHE